MSPWAGTPHGQLETAGSKMWPVRGDHFAHLPAYEQGKKYALLRIVLLEDVRAPSSYIANM
jgi:hypothetical protein